MGEFNSYWYIIAGGLVVILSHLYNYVSRKTNFPSVIFLILTGIGISELSRVSAIPQFEVMTALKVLGTIGIILIVLEAALDLKLSAEKWSMIWRSFVIALVILIVTALTITVIIQSFTDYQFFTALIFSVPLSIMSSAIIIPSVKHLSPVTREFMVYEGTFSDILGILFFYFLIRTPTEASIPTVTLHVIGNIVITVAVSIILSYLIIIIFKNIRVGVKFFSIFASLILIYALGKLFHLSSLLMILIFGLIVNNRKIFFRGFLQHWINSKVYDQILKDFKLFTEETAFLIRTYFFVIFGMTFVLTSITNIDVISVTALVLIALYVIRYINLRVFMNTKKVLPELFIAPRGLVTIILFYDIPSEYMKVGEMSGGNFEQGVVFLTIIATSIIMMFSLLFSKSHLDEAKGKIIGRH